MTTIKTRAAVSPEAERLLRRELAGGETLLWVGQPDPRRLARQASSLTRYLVGILFTAFALFWEIATVRMALGLPMTPDETRAPPTVPPAPFQGGALPLVVFGVPLVLLGLWLLAAPYWAWRKACRTAYAVTDERALVLAPNWRGTVPPRSITAEDLADRTRTENADGSGTLVFDRLTRHWTGAHGQVGSLTVGFEQVASVRAVDDLILQTFPRQTFPR